MTIRLSIGVLTATILATGVADAAPKLAGTYTLTRNEICQTTGPGAIPTDRGAVRQTLATVSVTADRMTVVGQVQGGRLVTAGPEQFTLKSFIEFQTIAIAGKTNPFVVTLVGTGGQSRAFAAHLVEIDAQGVVGQMVLSGTFADHAAAANCITQMVFLSH